MKNFTQLLLLIITVSFTSCKKNPDEKATANLVGKWYLQSYNEKEYKNGALIDERSSTKADQSVFVELKSNGTGIDSDNDKFSYKVSNSQLIIKYEDSDEEDIQEIKKITSSELVLVSEENWENGSDKHKYLWESNYKKK